MEVLKWESVYCNTCAKEVGVLRSLRDGEDGGR
jgi:hypothetical protein